MWNEVVVAAMEHEPRVILNKRQSMAMKIAEHGVAAPAAHNADVIRVHTAE